MIHIYTSVGCEGPIFLCGAHEAFGSIGHSQLSYLYNICRESNYANCDYCPDCADKVPQVQKDLALLATTELE